MGLLIRGNHIRRRNGMHSKVSVTYRRDAAVREGKESLSDYVLSGVIL